MLRRRPGRRWSSTATSAATLGGLRRRRTGSQVGLGRLDDAGEPVGLARATRAGRPGSPATGCGGRSQGERGAPRGEAAERAVLGFDRDRGGRHRRLGAAAGDDQAARPGEAVDAGVELDRVALDPVEERRVGEGELDAVAVDRSAAVARPIDRR